MTDPEYNMIEQLKAGECSVERALLMVSGLDEAGIKKYQKKLDQIEEDFTDMYERFSLSPPPEYRTAKVLFAYLFGGQNNLYNSDDFTLAKAIQKVNI